MQRRDQFYSPHNNSIFGASSSAMQNDSDNDGVINRSGYNINNLLYTPPTVDNLKDDKEKTEKEHHKKEEEEEDDEEAESLSSEFSIIEKIFVSLILIITMSLFVYSNTRDGAYVDVQVTSSFDNTTSSLMINENISPWSTSLLSYNSYKENENEIGSNNDDLNQFAELIQFIQLIQTEYPNLKISDKYNNDINTEYLNENLHNVSALLDGFAIDLLKSSQDTIEIEVFNFTLTSSIEDFWNAEAYELAFVIAAFSGAWPYIKLLILLVIWLHPMKAKQRKKYLLILDQLGKYSFIDLYVCIFMVVSFYLTITEHLKNGFNLTVAVVVEIDTGVSTFAIGTLVSMFYSMVFIYLDERKRKRKRIQLRRQNIINAVNDNVQPVDVQQHEPIQYNEDNENDENDENDQAVEEIEIEDNVDCFENEIEEYSKLYDWRYDKTWKIWAFYDTPSSFMGILFRSLFLVLLIVNIWLCFQSIYSAPVRYDMGGLAGWAIDDNIRSYSIKGTADLLPSSTDMKTAAYFCVIQYYATVIIAPLIVSFITLFVWLFPMNYTLHNFICHLLFPLQAWMALDVFLIGTVAASFELDQVSIWILNTNYKEVCGPHGVIQSIFNTGCFDVMGHLTPGTLVLGIYIVFEWFALLYTISRIKNTHQRFAKYKSEPVKL